MINREKEQCGNLLEESDRRNPGSPGKHKKKENCGKTSGESSKRKRSELQEKKNFCDREQAGLTMKAAENQKQQQNMADEIRLVVEEQSGKTDSITQDIWETGKEILETEIRERQQEYRSLKENQQKGARDTLQRFQAEKERIASSIETFESAAKRDRRDSRRGDPRTVYKKLQQQKAELTEKRKELFSIQSGNREVFQKVQKHQEEMTAAEKEYVMDQESLGHSQRKP